VRVQRIFGINGFFRKGVGFFESRGLYCKTSSVFSSAKYNLLVQESGNIQTTSANSFHQLSES